MEPKFTIVETDNAVRVVNKLDSLHLYLCVCHGAGAHDFFYIGSLHGSVGFDAPKISGRDKCVDGSFKKSFQNSLGFLNVLCMDALVERREELAVKYSIRREQSGKMFSDDAVREAMIGDLYLTSVCGALEHSCFFRKFVWEGNEK